MKIGVIKKQNCVAKKMCPTQNIENLKDNIT